MRGFMILFLVTSFLTAQKVVKKSILNTNISQIQIDASNCFEMNIANSETEILVVTASIEGEYKKDLVLNVTEEGSTVMINADFQPNFKNPNDKLSAHKVVSIALDIELPKNKNINVFGNSCNVTIKGNYNNLKVTLNDGACNLSSVFGSVDVSTQSGMIKVESEAATIDSKSKFGIIDGEIIPSEKNAYYLRSITGNIILKRIE